MDLCDGRLVSRRGFSRVWAGVGCQLVGMWKNIYYGVLSQFKYVPIVCQWMWFTWKCMLTVYVRIYTVCELTYTISHSNENELTLKLEKIPARSQPEEEISGEPLSYERNLIKFPCLHIVLKDRVCRRRSVLRLLLSAHQLITVSQNAWRRVDLPNTLEALTCAMHVIV